MSSDLLEVKGDDGGGEGRTTTADWQSAPEVRLASAEAQATPDAAPMNLELHEVMGNAGGDEGRITTADLQVAPCGAGRRSPFCEDSARRRKQLVDLRHSIEKGAVEVQIKLICAALLCHSGARWREAKALAPRVRAISRPMHWYSLEGRGQVASLCLVRVHAAPR